MQIVFDGPMPTNLRVSSVELLLFAPSSRFHHRWVLLISQRRNNNKTINETGFVSRDNIASRCSSQAAATHIHTLAQTHIIRALLVVPLARPICPSVFSTHDAHVRMSMSMLNVYAEWSASNIRSLKSSIYIDRLAFNRWSSSPLPS